MRYSNRTDRGNHTSTSIFPHRKLTLKRSVQETFKQVGFDPAYKSLLIYYPLEVGDQTVENITGNPTKKP